MKNIIRDNSETKDVAAVMLVVTGFPGGEDGQFQLFYDYDAEKPLSKDEAFLYMASGKACAVHEFADDEEIKTFANISSICKMTLDESVPNGYFLTLMNDEETSSTGSLKYYGSEYFNVDDDGIITNTGSAHYDPTPFEILKNGSVIDEPENYANYYITAIVTMPYGNTGETIKTVANLMFSSAWKFFDPNYGTTRGIMSFVGHLDLGVNASSNSITVRYELNIDDNAENEATILILPN